MSGAAAAVGRQPEQARAAAERHAHLHANDRTLAADDAQAVRVDRAVQQQRHAVGDAARALVGRQLGVSEVEDLGPLVGPGSVVEMLRARGLDVVRVD